MILFLCFLVTGHLSRHSVSKSLSRGINNVFRTSQASLPQTPSKTKIPLPTKPSQVQNSSSNSTEVFGNGISKAISSVSLASSHIPDDTSELSGLYHLISFQEVDKPRRQGSYSPTALITTSRQNGHHSPRRDLATMLGELAGSNSPSQNVQESSTVGSGTLESISLGTRGKPHKRSVFNIDLSFSDRAY